MHWGLYKTSLDPINSSANSNDILFWLLQTFQPAIDFGALYTLCRLFDALEINQADCLMQLAQQLSSLNSFVLLFFFFFLGGGEGIKLIGLNTSYFLHLNRKWLSSSNSSVPNGHFMSIPMTHLYNTFVCVSAFHLLLTETVLEHS